MSSDNLDLKPYNFSGAEGGPIADPRALPNADKKRMLMAGVDLDSAATGGSFLHVNHDSFYCASHQDGLELMDIKSALSRFGGLPGYYWRAVDRDRDEITRMAAERLHGGYFIRARKGVKVRHPVQSCLFIKGSGIGQNVHNVIVVEEGAEMHIISGCAVGGDTRQIAHLGISEFYVEKGGSLTFTMIHNWGEASSVRPRSAGILEEGASFQNNYILLEKVADLQMYPSIALNGRDAVARFNSVMVAPPGANVDAGTRLLLNAPGTRGESVARSITTGGVMINRGFIGAYAVPAKGHLECKSLILGGGISRAIPAIEGAMDGVELSHEAAVGKIAREEIEYLMARGLDEEEATSTIVRGFLNVDIMGLPKALSQSMQDAVARLNTRPNM